MLIRCMAALFVLVSIPISGAALAQTFPPLSGRVVDGANLLSPVQEQEITARLATLEQQSGRQVVVVTIPDLQGYDIADYGYRLGRAWGIGSKAKNDGALLIVAPKEHKVRIEVGYGLEGVLTDALSSQIVRNSIVPKFKANDYPGGITAGVTNVATLLTLPPDEAKAQAALAAQQEADRNQGSDPGGLVIFAFILLFFILPLFFRGRYGRSYRSGIGPAILWGAALGSSGRSSNWGGGGSSFGGGGGFSGGGGSFGGGGASGGW
ncbi:MAG: TPM domain-containing protein [Sphingobium sp.]